MKAFVPFNKIPRLHGACVVTEKIDGTNACVEFEKADGTFRMAACSRNRRLVTVEWREDAEPWPLVSWEGKGDNYGFGQWFLAHYLELRALGYGRHFGEWWGQGIQRRYGLEEKRFSLFHHNPLKTLPACVSVVPTLEVLEAFSSSQLDMIMASLKVAGSQAAPGFMDPEGIVVFHERSGQLFKYTYEAGPKGQKEE
jgi:hypothetical protein